MGIEDVTRHGVVLPLHVDPAGTNGPTPKAVRGTRWRRVGRGWYVGSDADPGVLEQRIVEAIAGMPPTAAVTGWAALAWQGGRWFGGVTADGELLPVPVAVGDRQLSVQRGGRRLCEDWLFEDDVTTVDGLRITVPNRSVTYEVRRARTLIRAVQTIDMAAYDDLIDLSDLDSYVARLVSRPGIRLTRRAVRQGRENVWSPMETLQRLAWQAAIPAATLLCNPAVFDLAGNHLFTPDLFDPGAGVAGEYNGRIHDGVPTQRRDLDKEEAYRRHGIEHVAMMSTDLRDTHNFEVRLRAAYARAGSRGGAVRWTLDQPDWWVDTSTVARRRALTPDQAAIWLRRRIR